MTQQSGAHHRGMPDGLVCAEFGSVCVVIWRNAVTLPRFAVQERALANCVRRHGSNSAFLCIIEPSCEPPKEAMRRASVRMIAEHDRVLSCVAVVIEASGFRGALARSVLSTMELLKGSHRVPVTYADSVDAAVAWLDARMLLPHDLRRSIDELRSRLDRLASASG